GPTGRLDRLDVLGGLVGGRAGTRGTPRRRVEATARVGFERGATTPATSGLTCGGTPRGNWSPAEPVGLAWPRRPVVHSHSSLVPGYASKDASGGARVAHSVAQAVPGDVVIPGLAAP
ncbi:hypothetical protein K7G98_18560, partial [Saccharothrix sp. MB29]|nr:hypothetical protein [Saccharothrix sp. MB29]